MNDIYTIPLFVLPHYSFSISLEQSLWRCEVHWNGVTQAWYKDLKGVTYPTLHYPGIKLVGGVNLIQGLAIAELGQLIMVDTTGDNHDPDYDNIGTRFLLQYLGRTAPVVYM